MKHYDLNKRYEYFLSRTIRNENGCFIWQGTTNGNGYAHASVQNRIVYLHRFIAAQSMGLDLEDIKGTVVMHSCDNSRCINPYHLTIADQSNNIQDSYNKGRSNQKGEDNGSSKLSEQEILAIRYEYTNLSIPQWELANKYNISQQHVSEIINRKVWAHI